MGDTYSDPIDHHRTTRPHAGRAVINVRGWPGYLLVVVGLIAVVLCLDAFGTHHQHQGMETLPVAVVATMLGVAWLAVEHRRISRVASHWDTHHPHLGHPHLHLRRRTR